MGNDFEKLLIADRRLAILRFLSEDNDYSLNDSVLQSALYSIGHSVSRDTLRADLSFLKEVGAITYDVPIESVYVAKLSEKGLDIALGRSVVPGIKKPSPK